MLLWEKGKSCNKLPFYLILWKINFIGLKAAHVALLSSDSMEHKDVKIDLSVTYYSTNPFFLQSFLNAVEDKEEMFCGPQSENKKELRDKKVRNTVKGHIF